MPECPEIFDIDRSGQHADAAQDQFGYARETNQQEQIEPCRHEPEIRNALNGDECSSNQQHLPSIGEVGQQGKHEQEHPH